MSSLLVFTAPPKKKLKRFRRTKVYFVVVVCYHHRKKKKYYKYRWWWVTKMMSDGVEDSQTYLPQCNFVTSVSLQASVFSPVQMCIPNSTQHAHNQNAPLRWETREKLFWCKIYLVLKFKILGWNCSDDKESCALMDSLARLSSLSAYASCESSSRPDFANDRISTKMKRIINMVFNISIECVHSSLMFF